MTTRSNGPLAGFGWLKRGINVGYGNPKALFGGAAFLLLLCLLPTLITMPLQFGALRAGTQPDPATFGSKRSSGRCAPVARRAAAAAGG